MGDWDKAIAAAQQALRIRPDFVLARNNLANSPAQKKPKSLSSPRPGADLARGIFRVKAFECRRKLTAKLPGASETGGELGRCDQCGEASAGGQLYASGSISGRLLQNCRIASRSASLRDRNSTPYCRPDL